MVKEDFKMEAEKCSQRQRVKKKLLENAEIMGYGEDVALVSNQDVVRIYTEIFIKQTTENRLSRNKQRNPQFEKLVQQSRQIKMTWNLKQNKVKFKKPMQVQRAWIFKIQHNQQVQKECYNVELQLNIGFYIYSQLLNIAILKYGSKANQLILQSRVLGLDKNFRKKIIDQLIGRSEFDLKKVIFKKKVQTEIFRRHYFRDNSEMEQGEWYWKESTYTTISDVQWIHKRIK